jgi:outer membrane receptor protein involved in Fe transport
VARGFREPTLSDRFSRGPVGRGFLEGNPDLRPEYSLQFDVHVRFMTRLLVITAAGYHYRMRDLVERYAAGADLFRMRNRGQARLSGVEIEASIPLPAAFAVEVRAETSRGEDPATGAPIDDIAPERLGVTVHRGFGPAAGFVRATAVGAHHRAGPSEVATPGYLLIDAGFRWPISPNVDVVLAARNLTNAEFHSSAGPRWVWAPGRQVVVTASFGLGR